MNTSPYETVKSLQLQTDLNTKLVVDISARDQGERRSYRVGTFRVYIAGDGTERRSPWLGIRELMLKPGLEKAATDWIAEEENRRRATPVAA